MEGTRGWGRRRQFRSTNVRGGVNEKCLLWPRHIGCSPPPPFFVRKNAFLFYHLLFLYSFFFFSIQVVYDYRFHRPFSSRCFFFFVHIFFSSFQRRLLIYLTSFDIFHSPRLRLCPKRFRLDASLLRVLVYTVHIWRPFCEDNVDEGYRRL